MSPAALMEFTWDIGCILLLMTVANTEIKDKKLCKNYACAKVKTGSRNKSNTQNGG